MEVFTNQINLYVAKKKQLFSQMAVMVVEKKLLTKHCLNSEKKLKNVIALKAF